MFVQKKEQMSKPSRRELLAGLTAGAFLLSGAPLSRSENFDLPAGLADDSEYMFEPGLYYLNEFDVSPDGQRFLGEQYSVRRILLRRL